MVCGNEDFGRGECYGAVGFPAQRDLILSKVIGGARPTTGQKDESSWDRSLRVWRGFGLVLRNNARYLLSMPQIDFETLPDNARLWVFAASRPLNGDEEQRFLASVDTFLRAWNAHRVPLTVGRDWRYAQFLLIGVDETASGVSGCSVDALVHRLSELEGELDVTLTANAPVWYRDNGTIACVPRDEFKRRVERGVVQLDTAVFDNTIQDVGALRAGRWEVPARDSWHAKAFFY